MDLIKKYKTTYASFATALSQKDKGLKFHHIYLAIFAFIFPLTLALQPLIGGISSQLIIGVRFLILPIILLVVIRKYIYWPSLLLLIIFLLANGFVLLFTNSYHFIFEIVSLTGAIILYRVGAISRLSNKLNIFWEALIYGISLLNIVSIVILYSATSGIINPSNLLTALGKSVDYGLGRFSLGNPIELPFLVCTLLHAALKNSPRKESYVFLALLNFVLCLISESRLIVIIGALIFFQEFRLSSLKVKIFIAVILGTFLIYSHEIILVLLDSIWARLNGADYGSSDDRFNIFITILQEISFFSLLIGNGLTSSAETMRLLSGIYRSVESSFLQLFFETGLFGVGLIISTLMLGKKPVNKSSYIGKSIDLVAILLWIELLFLLPITDQTPLVTFGLGASSIYSYKYIYKIK